MATQTRTLEIIVTENITLPTVLHQLILEYQRTTDYIVTYDASSFSLLVHPLSPKSSYGDRTDQENDDDKDDSSEKEEKQIRPRQQKLKNNWQTWFNLPHNVLPGQIILHKDKLYVSDQLGRVTIISATNQSLWEQFSFTRPSASLVNIFDGGSAGVQLFVCGGSCHEKNHNRCTSPTCSAKVAKLYDPTLRAYTDLPHSTAHSGGVITEVCIVYSDNIVCLFARPTSEQFNFKTRQWSTITNHPSEIVQLGHSVAIPGLGILFFRSKIYIDDGEWHTSKIYLYQVTKDCWAVLSVPMIPLSPKDTILQVAHNPESGLISLIIHHNSHANLMMIWKIHISKLCALENQIYQADQDDADCSRRRDAHYRNLYKLWLGPLFIESYSKSLVDVVHL